MHNGEFDTRHSSEGDLYAGLRIKDVSVIDVRLLTVLVVIAKNIISAGEVGVV